MYSNHTKYHKDPMHIDNPNLNFGVKLYLYLRPIGPYIALGILGIILWMLSYMIIFFLKDFLVTYLKKETDRGYYYKYLEYTRFAKPVFYFSLIVSSFWIILVIILKEWRWFTFSTGCFFFTILYMGYLFKYYLIEKHDFDLFDDYVFLFKRMISKKKTQKIKKD